MNPPWQPPDSKRFRPNDGSNNRPWAAPQHHPGGPHQPNVHPSRQAQLPPPPPVAPYHQQPHIPRPPQPAPYFQQQQPPPGPPPSMHQMPAHHYNPHAPPHPHNSHSSHPPVRRNKTSDPRGQRHLYHHHMTAQKTSSSVLDVLHIAADDLKNFGSFAVTLNQIYGSRNIDGLPFGSSSSDAIQFDGRIRSSPILSFAPEAIETPSKKVRVYELSPLAAADKQSYDELVAFFTKHERCPVVDKEYNMGILLYFVPPKLITKKVEPSMSNQDPKDRKKRKKQRKDKEVNRTNFVELLGLSGRSGLREDRVWMISITSTSKYLLYKKKTKDKAMQKENEKKERKNRKKKRVEEGDLSDIEISDSDGDSESVEDSAESDTGEMGEGKKKDDIPKSELIIALEALYKQIGQKLPDPL